MMFSFFYSIYSKPAYTLNYVIVLAGNYKSIVLDSKTTAKQANKQCSVVAV